MRVIIFVNVILYVLAIVALFLVFNSILVLMMDENNDVNDGNYRIGSIMFVLPNEIPTEKNINDK